MRPLLLIQLTARGVGALVWLVLAVLAGLGLVWLIWGPMQALAGAIIAVICARGAVGLLTTR
jgi:hypothetical protein